MAVLVKSVELGSGKSKSGLFSVMIIRLQLVKRWRVRKLSKLGGGKLK